MSSRFEEEEEKRKKSEEEYVSWVEFVAREVAVMLKNLEVNEITKRIDFYEKCLKSPASMHLPFESEREEEIEKIVGKDRLKDIILLKTEAVIFAPSTFSPFSNSFDYGIAMHRRFFLRGLWFSIIALNEAYFKLATESMLRYVLEHELIQGELYNELATQHIKSISPKMKAVFHEEARIKAIQRSGVSTEELDRERNLISDLSFKSPMIPTGFAAVSLFKYLEENWEKVKCFGIPSQTETEKELEKASTEFVNWLDFSFNAYRAFLKELKEEMSMTGAEYGSEIV
jgi:hypothetical protein